MRESNKFFNFGPNYKFATDSIFQEHDEDLGQSLPPVSGHLNLLDSTDFLLLNSTNFLLL